MQWQSLLIIQTLVSQENLEDFSRYYFAVKNAWFENAVPWYKLSLLRHINVLDRLQSIRI